MSKNVHTLILKNSISKKKNANDHLSLQWFILFLLVKDLTSMLMAANWSGGGSYWKNGVAAAIS